MCCVKSSVDAGPDFLSLAQWGLVLGGPQTAFWKSISNPWRAVLLPEPCETHMPRECPGSICFRFLPEWMLAGTSLFSTTLAPSLGPVSSAPGTITCSHCTPRPPPLCLPHHPPLHTHQLAFFQLPGTANLVRSSPVRWRVTARSSSGNARTLCTGLSWLPAASGTSQMPGKLLAACLPQLQPVHRRNSGVTGALE